LRRPAGVEEDPVQQGGTDSESSPGTRVGVADDALPICAVESSGSACEVLQPPRPPSTTEGRYKTSGSSLGPALPPAGSVGKCRRCDTVLAPGEADVREYLCVNHKLAASRMADLGAEIVAREGVDLVERTCPG